MRAMGFRHVIGNSRVCALARRASVRGDTPTGVKDFECAGGEPDIDFAAHERVRNRVEVTVNFDVIVDIDARVSIRRIRKAVTAAAPAQARQGCRTVNGEYRATS